MKLLVFAHTPPPHHGQSYMVQLMLDGFGGDRRRSRGKAGQPVYGIECYHVNARLSKNIEDVGIPRPGKLVFLLGHCLQAIWSRFRYGAATLYYVPAPGKKAALYRDWLVMSLCRPFFKRVVFHWHATSLAKWLETFATSVTRRIAYRLMGQVDLSVALSQYNQFNAEKMWPRRLAVVANGIPDPCADFEAGTLPRRKARLTARKKLLAGQELNESMRLEAGGDPQVVRVLFLAHCTREKGLFDAAHAVLKANEQLRMRRSPLAFQLVVAGSFQTLEEKNAFDALQEAAGHAAIHYMGFVEGEGKAQALHEADLLCFPSHWENQPVSVIEALAFGLPTVISRLPSVQEMLPQGYRGVADLKNPDQIAKALLDLAAYEDFSTLREHFVSHFTLQHFCSNLAAELRTIDPDPA